MTMTDAEIRERSTLTLLRIIVRQEEEIEGLRKTLASTAQVAADAEKREADAASAELLHKQEWSKSLPSITPDDLRALADGLANQNSAAERVAARYAASADMLDALRCAEALANVGLLNASEELIAAVADKRRAAIAKAERPQP